MNHNPCVCLLTVHHAWPAKLFDLGCQKIKRLILIDWVEKEVPILYLQTADSFKEFTRERGHGVRRKVSGPTKQPSNWMDFICDSINKEMFSAFCVRTSLLFQ